ncbi:MULTISPECIES: sensor histidine kinase [Maribacter]|uniref:histidine kinase n=1 Tax=Maribacter flavus TaxID=1658664 RepID=A0ABU7IK77_9FLAO|nr:MULTISPECIES: sensor histidine kinase [Maribacter]MDC6406247.1 sensor histidine kinase [Maribacter sp. PR66]MEE1973367.1 sensor histidine kinase [Maribacter flavus]
MDSMEVRYISTIVFTAIFSVFGIYHLLSFLVLKHRILLYYAILIFGLTLHWSLYLFIEGRFGPNIANIAYHASLVTAMLTTFGLLKFTENYLNIDKEGNPRLFKIYKLLILLVIVLPVLHILNILTVINPLLSEILELLAACTALVTLIINIVSGFLLFKTKKFNTYYLYANTPLLISGVLYVVTWFLMNHFPINTGFIVLVSAILITLQLILFSILIGFKFKFLEDENIKMQVAANELLKIEVDKQTEKLQIAKQKLEDQNEELVKVNKLKNKLFSLITHDVRAPLVNLGQMVDIIESELANEEMKNFTGKLKSDISYKITMVNGLLQWSYNQLEGVQLNKEKCDLQSIFSAIKKEFEKMAKDKQIDISLNIDCETLFIDKNMLLVVLRNLTSNAIKFSENGQKVVLWSKGTTEVIEVGVRDYGVGMDMDWYKNLEKQDAPKTSLGTDGEKGTGFGLIIAKDFTEMNGGTLFCESTKGKGTNSIMRFAK